MPYTPPTLEQFRQQFPVFVDISDDVINGHLLLAERSVDFGWFELDYQPGIAYLAAHYTELMRRAALQAAGIGGGGGGSGSGGAETYAKTIKFADRSVTYDLVNKPPSANAGSGSSTYRVDFNATPYGQIYLTILGRNAVHVLVI